MLMRSPPSTSLPPPAVAFAPIRIAMASVVVSPPVEFAPRMSVAPWPFIWVAPVKVVV